MQVYFLPLEKRRLGAKEDGRLAGSWKPCRHTPVRRSGNEYPPGNFQGADMLTFAVQVTGSNH